ncbi:MAG: portal protein, partial [Ilumatobacteraceae bacterium]
PSGYVMPDPEMQYNSRIALAIRALENGSILQTMDMFLPFSELKPELWDNLDADKAFRDAARNSGMPSRWIRDQRETDQLRAQRAEAQAQAQQVEQAETLAKAARNASGADPDKLQQLLGQ